MVMESFPLVWVVMGDVPLQDLYSSLLTWRTLWNCLLYSKTAQHKPTMKTNQCNSNTKLSTISLFYICFTYWLLWMCFPVSGDGTVVQFSTPDVGPSSHTRVLRLTCTNTREKILFFPSPTLNGFSMFKAPLKTSISESAIYNFTWCPCIYLQMNTLVTTLIWVWTWLDIDLIVSVQKRVHARVFSRQILLVTWSGSLIDTFIIDGKGFVSGNRTKRTSTTVKKKEHWLRKNYINVVQTRLLEVIWLLQTQPIQRFMSLFFHLLLSFFIA